MQELKVKKGHPPPQVVHDGEIPRILVPSQVTMREAAGYCAAVADEQEKVVPIVRDFECLPWVAAFATEAVLMRDYSATAKGAVEIQIPSAKGTVSVRWGTWEIAGLGKLVMEATEPPNGFGIRYRAVVHVKRMDAHLAEDLFAKIDAEIGKRELYRGVALALEPNEKGQLYLKEPPKVVHLSAVEPADIILERDLETDVRALILQPIQDTEAVKAAGVPIRRGVLCAGRPGTGKTLTARCAAHLALKRDWTVFYLGDARGIEPALKIAQAHSPAVLITEDIDRQLGGERDAHVDRILNALDGLDRKAEVVFIATTNDPEALPAALLRPGRLDAVLVFECPDAIAAERLLRMYLGRMAPDNMGNAGRACAGMLPAAIREVASRSILHARYQGLEAPDHACLESAAVGVRRQQRMLEESERRHSMKTVPEVVVHHKGNVPDPASAAAAGFLGLGNEGNYDDLGFFGPDAGV